MAGRAYTMKEMKQIVDYLVEHKAYSEVRGRKMWMGLASSKILSRTWQSMKETFLKRVLPDIHNPYYKLTVEQIASFRQECDIELKNKSKLEVQIVSEESNASDNQQAKAQAVKKQEEQTGEDKIQSHTRSSTETLVLENCYETAEDIQKELESPTKNVQAQKSLRDFITYSEPLTPMLQEVLHDFSSDDEPQLQIVDEPEGPPKVGESDSVKKSKSPETIRESQSYTKKTENVANGDEPDKNSQSSKIKSLKLKKTRKGTWENKEAVDNVASTVQEKETNNNNSDMVFTGQENSTDLKINTAIPDRNHSNSATDTQLPNNQEELGDKPNLKRKSTESSNTEFVEPSKKKKEKPRKRSHSQSSVEKKKNKKDRDSIETHEQEKDTQTFNSHPQAAAIQKELVNGIQIVQESSDNKTNLTNDTNITPNVVVEDTALNKSNEGTSQEAGPSGVNPGDINPCLKSVSLFEEQFSQTKYSDSDSEVAPIDKLNENHEQGTIENNHGKDDSRGIDKSNKSEDSAVNTKSNGIAYATTSKDRGIDDVVVLKSHSDTSCENFGNPKKRDPVGCVNKSKEKSLANMFGFASGGVHKRILNHSKANSRRLSQRHRINSRTFNVDSGSSDEYTTASDSEDSSPANSRTNRHRKYVKPPSFDFLGYENGLFVVGRKKIYPLMLRENGSLHYTCSSEGVDNEEADSYWKEKYLEEKQKLGEEKMRAAELDVKLAEEKIRADELARLLRKAQEAEEAKEPKSPILQANQSLNTFVNKNQPTQDKAAVIERDPKPEEKVKIKFNRNKDIELEGQWANINPILERMVEIFKNDDAEAGKAKQESDSKPEEKPSAVTNEVAQTKTAKPKNKRSLSRKESVKAKPLQIRDSDDNDEGDKTEETVSISSGTDVRIKVSELESEIFEKIAEIEKTDQSIPERSSSVASTDTNVTKRKRGRPKKIVTSVQNNARSSVSLDTAPKKRAASTENIAKKARAQSVEIVPKKGRSRALSEGPAKRANLTEAVSDAGTSKRATRAPKRFGSESNLTARAKRVRSVSRNSKLLLPARAESPDSASAVSIPEDDQVKYMFPPANTKKLTKADKSRRYAIGERTLTSPASSRQSSTPDYHDSDITPPNITRRKRKMTTVGLVHKRGLIRKVKRKSCPYLADDDSCSTNESQTQNTGAIPNASQSINSEVYRSDSYQILMPKAKQLSYLDKIEENPMVNETETNKNNLDNPVITINLTNGSDELRNNSEPKGSEVNSSSISFPLSPELSIVENLSISKDLISSSLEEPPTIKETSMNEIQLPTTSNNYLISDVDASMPLMEQDCGFQTEYKNRPRNRRTSFSESIGQEQYFSESLDQKLRDLLLESAKKIAQEEPAHKDSVMEIDIVASEKKSNAKPTKKRRSSTPCKNKTVLRSKTPEVEPVIEEHTESCFRSGRNSCPPVIHVRPCEDSENLQANIRNDNKTAKNNPGRGRKKKDVIKVKILRPRSISCSKDRTHMSRQSICTDSGINETESGVSDGCDISTELIHNHSDTCLHLDECVGESLELVENANQSVISLSSNSGIHSGKEKASKDISEECGNPEMFCSNAQDATSLNNAKKPSERDTVDATTAYFTPPSGESFNSLITEDLSDDVKHSSPTKWYLLSEHETNFFDTCSQSTSASVGSNLNKIFTPFAVPDLSTISERSKENYTKTVINTDTESDAISQSLFDIEF